MACLQGIPDNCHAPHSYLALLNCTMTVINSVKTSYSSLPTQITLDTSFLLLFVNLQLNNWWYLWMPLLSPVLSILQSFHHLSPQTLNQLHNRLVLKVLNLIIEGFSHVVWHMVSFDKLLKGTFSPMFNWDLFYPVIGFHASFFYTFHCTIKVNYIGRSSICPKKVYNIYPWNFFFCKIGRYMPYT